MTRKNTFMKACILTSFESMRNWVSWECRDVSKPSRWSSWPFRQVNTNDKKGWWLSSEELRWTLRSLSLFLDDQFPLSNTWPINWESDNIIHEKKNSDALKKKKRILFSIICYYLIQWTICPTAWQLEKDFNITMEIKLLKIKIGS